MICSTQVIPRRIYVLSCVVMLFVTGSICPNSTHAATNYSIRFGGSDGDFPTAVMSYVGTIITGYTYSTNFPGAAPRVAANESDADVFVTKLGPNGEIVWSVI